MRPIDADEFMEQYNLKDATKYGNKDAEQQNHSYSTLYLYELAGMIDDAPTIDIYGKWIPCSERLPEEHDSMFAKFKGTDRWDNAMFEKTSDTVIVTVSDTKGGVVTTHAHTTDGNWKCDLLRVNKSYRITAWMPLPEPYKGE